MRADLEWGTIANLVQAAGDRYGDREAVVGPRSRIGYAELACRVRRAAAGVMAAGVRPGDRIGIWAPNTPDYVVAALGAVSAGAVLVPLNTRLKGGEAAELLRRTRTRLLFVTSNFLGVSYVAALKAAGPLPELLTTVVLGETAAVPGDLLSWRGFLAAGADIPDRAVQARIAAVAPGDPADIMFTSGTTGLPKGAVTTHAQTLRAFDTWADLSGLAEGDRYLVVNPFTHTFGWKAGILASLMRGATILPQPVFDAEAVLAKIATERVTVLPGAPTVYQTLLDHPAREQYDLTSLRLAVTGAAVVPLELVHRIRDELGFDTVLTAYGLTESCGMVTMCRRDDTADTVAATSGRAVPGVEVRVRSAEGKDQAAGEPGEVQVRGYTVMRGYFEDPAATAETFTEDGWLRTGDIGVLDAGGNVRITDRLKDMYTVGGFNAYPAEIERILARHPLVADSAVIGVPDPRLGEVGRAYVIPRQQPSPEAASELVDWCRREMANYKVPREVVFVDDLPRNAIGKVLKGELRKH
ncbi:FadD3 family acyl-CoA ligase [Streptacidiphilus jiangxiensis]|uniref:Acyl-CoA synthetase (AMP-forming)/AMP-acid ligase II n=1 Tax=Streptacidiphilus jiangxiensis TaxID=235985 RepID=A0A1H7F892_STRJI|nr:FadD3 family acyl-CoA ligase [Streptacidiphilus jiangxiensis]SEK22306.1 Acyl-CoA synthetase (AMP-forming)/AMP-acid ligase II [Streptacidiphilus jiangxiensis]